MEFTLNEQTDKQNVNFDAVVDSGDTKLSLNL